MTDHTPGPWERLPRSPANGMLTVTDRSTVPVAYVVDLDKEHANWRLIAAAPELLEALQDLLTFVDPNENLIGQHMEIDVARHVIDKARGRK